MTIELDEQDLLDLDSSWQQEAEALTLSTLQSSKAHTKRFNDSHYDNENVNTLQLQGSRYSLNHHDEFNHDMTHSVALEEDDIQELDESFSISPQKKQTAEFSFDEEDPLGLCRPNSHTLQNINDHSEDEMSLNEIPEPPTGKIDHMVAMHVDHATEPSFDEFPQSIVEASIAGEPEPSFRELDDVSLSHDVDHEDNLSLNEVPQVDQSVASSAGLRTPARNHLSYNHELELEQMKTLEKKSVEYSHNSFVIPAPPPMHIPQKFSFYNDETPSASNRNKLDQKVVLHDESPKVESLKEELSKSYKEQAQLKSEIERLNSAVKEALVYKESLEKEKEIEMLQIRKELTEEKQRQLEKLKHDLAKEKEDLVLCFKHEQNLKETKWLEEKKQLELMIIELGDRLKNQDGTKKDDTKPPSDYQEENYSLKHEIAEKETKISSLVGENMRLKDEVENWRHRVDELNRNFVIQRKDVSTSVSPLRFNKPARQLPDPKDADTISKERMGNHFHIFMFIYFRENISANGCKLKTVLSTFINQIEGQTRKGISARIRRL